MKTKMLTVEDIEKYLPDLVKCCSDNPQITDYQGYLDVNNEEAVYNACLNYLYADDSAIQGIFDDDEIYLFGFIVYDNIRLTDDGNASEVHICMSKHVWGKEFYKIYTDILDNSLFDVIYCQIPSHCRGAITLCKRLGFTKTGYIPKVIPYVTVKGEVKMFDQYIYVYTQKEKNG